MSQAGIGKLQNLGVTVQRRWNNVLSDAHHQQIIEMFLGLRMRQYFPSVTFLYPEAAVPLEGESDDEGGSSGSVLARAVVSLAALPTGLATWAVMLLCAVPLPAALAAAHR